MPYVREKTWIQMAPRIPNLSLRESPYGPRRGMGQAVCPSLEQLSGITDPSDPCQTGGSGATVSQQIANLPGYQASLPNYDLLSTNSAGQLTSPAYPATFMNWLQANGSMVLLGGAGLLGLVFLSKLK